ncbi:MAG: hypothetical protein V2A73_00980 [Pseudomonadota bacterium]
MPRTSPNVPWWQLAHGTKAESTTQTRRRAITGSEVLGRRPSWYLAQLAGQGQGSEGALACSPEVRGWQELRAVIPVNQELGYRPA